jgi:hypothetical protein
VPDQRVEPVGKLGPKANGTADVVGHVKSYPIWRSSATRPSGPHGHALDFGPSPVYPRFVKKRIESKPREERPKRHWRRHSLGGAVEDLALSASLQIEHLRSIGEIPRCDDLALDFETAYAAVRGTLKMGVAAKLENLDAALADMRSRGDASLWRTDALDGTDWNHVRGLAREALHALDQSDTSVDDLQRALVRELAGINPALNEITRRHLEDYDDLLPQVLLGDIAKYYLDEVRSGRAHSPAIMALLKVLENGRLARTESNRELIVGFFVEYLPGEDQEDAIEEMLPLHPGDAPGSGQRKLPGPIRLKSAERALASYMSQLSETAYSAGWMSNLEHSLWRAVIDGPFRFGSLELTTAQVGQLRRLSAACGGWIRFDAGETFVTIEEWRRLYDPALARG